jgi:hypothetical protein
MKPTLIYALVAAFVTAIAQTSAVAKEKKAKKEPTLEKCIQGGLKNGEPLSRVSQWCVQNNNGKGIPRGQQ